MAIASVFGVTGLTYLVFLTNILGAVFFYTLRNPIDRLGTFGHGKHYWTASILIIVHLLFGWWRRDAVELELQSAPTLRVAIMQQNVTMTHRLERSPWVGIRDWGQQTLSILDQDPDLVVWPEGSLGGPVNPDDPRPAKALGENLSKSSLVV